jgi:hypothetical protein
MDFFFRKKDDRETDEGKPLLQINLSGRPYNAYSERDAAIKLWLPESIKDRLNEVSTYIDTSVSDFLRQILFIHLYGRVDFLGLLQTKHPTALNSHIDTGIVPDASPQVEIEVKAVKKAKVIKNGPEKSTSSVKIWVPSKMKSDLDQLALKNKASLSEYARHVIITHLLGNMPYDSSPFKAAPPADLEES